MARRLYFLIGLFFLIPHGLHAQAELIDDDPVLNHVYISAYWGVNSHTNLRTGFSSEYFWQKGKYSVYAEGNPIVLFKKPTPNDTKHASLTYPEMHDVHGIKQDHSWEVYFNYNPWHKLVSKIRRVSLYTSGNISYYTKVAISSARLDGFRAGIGGYRGLFFTAAPEQNFQNMIPYSHFNTNYNRMLLFMGAQRTSLFNYRIQPSIIERRAYKATVFADLMLGTGLILHDVRIYPSNEVVHVKPLHSLGFPHFGFRLGYKRMPGRYGGIGYCMEIGQYPRDPYRFYGNKSSAFYIRMIFNLGLTYPYQAMKFKEDNRLNNSHIGRDL